MSKISDNNCKDNIDIVTITSTLDCLLILNTDIFISVVKRAQPRSNMK